VFAGDRNRQLFNEVKRATGPHYLLWECTSMRLDWGPWLWMVETARRLCAGRSSNSRPRLRVDDVRIANSR